MRPVGLSTSDAPANPTVERSTAMRLRSWLQIIVGLLTIVLLSWSVVVNWETFSAAVLQMNPWLVFAAASSVLAGLYVNMLSWRSVVGAFGIRLGYRDSARVFFVSQLAKYIPGGIWPIVLSARTGRAAGLAARVSVTSMTIALLIGVTVGAVYSTGALFLVPAVREQYWWAPVVLLAIGVVILMPPILDRLIGLALRLMRREAVPALRYRPFAAAIAWSVLSWALLGTGLALLVAASQAISPFEFVLSVASYAIAWVSGFAAVIAPAGAGVREVVLGLTLGSFLPAASVLSIVVVDRILMTIGDVAMLVFTISPRTRTRSVPDAAPAPLFVTRKFPPSIGGMETLAVSTHRALQAGDTRTELIALGRNNRNLVWWLPVASMRLFWRCLLSRDRVILFGDALTWAAMGWIPRSLRVAAVPMVMGLDVTYDHPLYRMVVRPALRRASRIIAISESTRGAALAIGARPDRVHVVVLGLPPAADPPYSREVARKRLEVRYGLRPSDILLVTTGRLVRRKGVRWFVEMVLPALDDRFVYLIVGDGEDRGAIAAAAEATGVSGRVHLLGLVDDDERTEVLHGADLYVQPNIAVPGDVEGFGLVVTESSQAGLFTIAADREGLVDAVRDGVTGIRVPSEDAAAWVRCIMAVSLGPDRAEQARSFQRAAREIYSVDAMASELRENLDEVVADLRPSRDEAQRTAARPSR
ncbi:hypothetical protein GCM10023152_04000 [Agromyces bauzanensis]|uniref:Glycosyltransferase n=1 Tax=Agromyces bauzanensis TaxID=1308924 RepID=A0A917UP70_9MICO|nr:hypothetical protein GCM10011372_06570 [Agromyces bauzanensis]